MLPLITIRSIVTDLLPGLLNNTLNGKLPYPNYGDNLGKWKQGDALVHGLSKNFSNVEVSKVLSGPVTVSARGKQDVLVNSFYFGTDNFYSKGVHAVQKITASR